MAFALRAVHAIAAAPAFRATARVTRRAALVQTRAMSDEAAEDGPLLLLLCVASPASTQIISAR